jgi:short-subunit dehydrogenase
MMPCKQLFFFLVISVLLSGCATKLKQHDAQKVAGKTYVITGASSGFGRGVAMELGRLHANVVLAARRTELLNEVAAEVEKSGGKTLVVTTDVAKPENIKNLADRAVAKFGKVDVWINNAGISAFGRFEDIPVKDHSRVIDVNLKGVIYGSHAALKQFRTQGYGVLINIGSVGSEVPLAYQSTYSASKAGILSLSQTINQELMLNGLSETIKVVTIMPWATDTPFWRHAANYTGGTTRMAMLDGPEKVVNAIIRASVYPKNKVPVGWKAKSAYLSHRIFPDITEYISAKVVHKYQIETAPPAPITDGSLFEPMQGGAMIDDGVRERIKQENRERSK